MSEPLPDFLRTDRPPVPDVVEATAVQPFHLDKKPVRGRLVKLGTLADALLSRHDHPDAVGRLLGEALALTAGLAAALKYKGSFSIQAKGDGVVPMLVADCTDDGQLRGYARAEAEKLAELLSVEPAPGAGALLGNGYIAFTCDQGADMDRYQGIVALEGATLAEMTHGYFAASEQLRAFIRLACARTEDGWRATAFIMERVAAAGGIDDLPEAEADDAWTTAVSLASTLTDAEMLDDALPAEELLFRLFHQEGLMINRARALSYGCRCSRARLSGVLAGFPDDDLDHMAEEGVITMTCEFCNHGFQFNRAEVKR
ncbi:Hsp33 family molecular chaperone HslO [Rhodovarius crocodyli]|uniref:Hsp33 family molecular chaperone HslO n=1 Tax=Rhodovarius crocodyli TaxID=1979269 RepID=A0A437MN20_9PROT|nr:Hsp33 family molecular chaperone HslO [Rhodovarius crocodyli]RVT99045.1 Hsp33 family molecular chaperone HslO [Rhodovarius crocodyli]